MVRQCVLSCFITGRKKLSHQKLLLCFLFFIRKRLSSGIINKWTNPGLLHSGFRKVNSSPKTGSQKHHPPMAGKEMLVSTLSGSRGEGSPACRLMQRESHRTSARSGKRRLSKPRGQQLAIDVASHSFEVFFYYKKLTLCLI